MCLRRCGKLSFQILTAHSIQLLLLTMSNSSCLWIVNYSGRKLKLVRFHCNFMMKWSFSDIEAGEHRCFQVQFTDRCIKKEKGCSGLAEYAPDGTDQCHFQVQAIRDRKGCYYLQVDWTGIDLEKYSVFPPPLGESNIGMLGWNASNLCLTVLDRLHFSPLQPAALPPSSRLMEWMGYYSDIIGSLSLSEMTLPCSHNSGTYQPSAPMLPAYIRCQNQSLSSQLKAGVRVLDLRIAQSGIGEFIISHDIWKTHYNLQLALKEVTEFIDQTTKEIVILDFHRFNNLIQQDFNYSELKVQVRQALQDRFLPLFKGALTAPLKDLWSAEGAGKGRVVVAWNKEEARDDDMWPGICHEWYQHASTETKLHSSLKKTFSEDLCQRTGLWNVCVFRNTTPIFSPITNAKNLQGRLSTWFHGCADWTLRANIISTDFTEEYGNIIHAAICANLLKGAKKVNH